MFTMLIHVFGISAVLFHGGSAMSHKINPFLVDYIVTKWSYWHQDLKDYPTFRITFVRYLWSIIKQLKNEDLLHKPKITFGDRFRGIFPSKRDSSLTICAQRDRTRLQDEICPRNSYLKFREKISLFHLVSLCFVIAQKWGFWYLYRGR